MPRISRVVGIGIPHHVTQRGNYGGVVFENPVDMDKYLCLVSDYALKNSLSILAYCLMRNHVHFIVVPGAENSMARVFNSAHMRYAQYVNGRRRATGHLWQGRFYSCVLGGTHLLAAARYVERNPVRAGMVNLSGEWEWSSAGIHAGKKIDNYGFDLDALWSFIPEEKSRWEESLRQVDDARVEEILRATTRTGRPLGNPAFVAMLEKRLHRRLLPLGVGRPAVQKLFVGDK